MDKIQRLPDYLKTKIASVDNQNYKFVRQILNKNNFNTSSYTEEQLGDTIIVKATLNRTIHKESLLGYFSIGF